jgi:acetylornithine deacetylase/succinyl-diaminopimelate desuccinylase-like protein
MIDPVDRLLALAVRIQQIPAPTGKERKRARLVKALFTEEGLLDVSMDRHNNVFARLPGRERSRPLVVSAHLDTVFPAAVPAAVREGDRILGPGIGDNSLGVAALFGLTWMLRERGAKLDSDVWLAANSCEEGLGDLRGMKTVVRRFGADARAFLVIEGTALGQVYHRAVGVKRYRVTVKTPGGHSWSDYGQPSAVHELAAIVNRLTALSLPSQPRTTMNVGTIAGGSGVNVVASDAELELDVRSEDPRTLDAVLGRLEELIGDSQRKDVDVRISVIGDRPAGELAADHPLVRLAVECIGEQGLTATLTAGSTDANIPLSRGLPAVVLGVTTGGGAHTPQEYIDTPPIRKGMRQLLRFAERLMSAQ